jgi:hypothetical protein
VGSDNPLRKELEKMFPNANGEEINVLMDLFIIASQTEYNVGEQDE